MFWVTRRDQLSDTEPVSVKFVYDVFLQKVYTKTVGGFVHSDAWDFVDWNSSFDDLGVNNSFCRFSILGCCFTSGPVVPLWSGSQTLGAGTVSSYGTGPFSPKLLYLYTIFLQPVQLSMLQYVCTFGHFLPWISFIVCRKKIIQESSESIQSCEGWSKLILDPILDGGKRSERGGGARGAMFWSLLCFRTGIFLVVFLWIMLNVHYSGGGGKWWEVGWQIELLVFRHMFCISKM